MNEYNIYDIQACKDAIAAIREFPITCRVKNQHKSKVWELKKVIDDYCFQLNLLLIMALFSRMRVLLMLPLVIRILLAFVMQRLILTFPPSQFVRQNTSSAFACSVQSSTVQSHVWRALGLSGLRFIAGTEDRTSTNSMVISATSPGI